MTTFSLILRHVNSTEVVVQLLIQNPIKDHNLLVKLIKTSVQLAVVLEKQDDFRLNNSRFSRYIFSCKRPLVKDLEITYRINDNFYSLTIPAVENSFNLVCSSVNRDRFDSKIVAVDNLSIIVYYVQYSKLVHQHIMGSDQSSIKIIVSQMPVSKLNSIICFGEAKILHNYYYRFGKVLVINVTVDIDFERIKKLCTSKTRHVIFLLPRNLDMISYSRTALLINKENPKFETFNGKLKNIDYTVLHHGLFMGNISSANIGYNQIHKISVPCLSNTLYNKSEIKIISAYSNKISKNILGKFETGFWYNRDRSKRTNIISKPGYLQITILPENLILKATYSGKRCKKDVYYTVRYNRNKLYFLDRLKFKIMNGLLFNFEEI